MIFTLVLRWEGSETFHGFTGFHGGEDSSRCLLGCDAV